MFKLQDRNAIEFCLFLYPIAIFLSLTICSCFTHYLFLFHSLFVPVSLTICSCFTHYLFLFHSLFVPVSLTICSCFTHYSVSLPTISTTSTSAWILSWYINFCKSVFICIVLSSSSVHKVKVLSFSLL